MKLHELFENLFEAPLPPDYAPDIFDPKPGKYSSASIIKKFEQLGLKKIGKGSSRLAVALHVPASQFPADVLRKYNLPTSGMVETVLKLALNGKGLSQNSSELAIYDNYAHHSYGRYLLPILDTSARNKDIHLDDISLSNWIQMLRATKPSIPQFKAWFKSEFGNFLEDFSNAYKINDLWNIDLVKYNCTEEQEENWNDFVSLLQDTELGIGDIKRMANLGLYDGKIYILDYGYDSSVMALYHGTEKAEGFVDNSGNIKLKISSMLKRHKW